MGKKPWKLQPIRGWWNAGGVVKARLRQHGRNCSNLHVIEANKCITEANKCASEAGVSCDQNIDNDTLLGSVFEEQVEEFEDASKYDKEFDEISDSPLVDDDKSSENWEKISEGSFEEMYEVDNIDNASNSNVSRGFEFAVGYRSCFQKYLKHYKALGYFKPKIYVLSKNRCIVSCLNMSEKRKECSETDEVICVEVDHQEISPDVIDQDSCGARSDLGSHDSIDITACEVKEADIFTRSTEDQKLEKDEDSEHKSGALSDSTAAAVGVIGFYQGESKLQEDINKAEDPLLGLEYIVEIWDHMGLQNYSCWLCNRKQLEKEAVLDHVRSIAHRIEYLKKHFPSQCAKFSQSDVLSDGTNTQLDSVCKEITDGCAKLLPFISTQDYVDKHGDKLMESVVNAFHYEEKAIHSLQNSESCYTSDSTKCSDVSLDVSSTDLSNQCSNNISSSLEKPVLEGESGLTEENEKAPSTEESSSASVLAVANINDVSGNQRMSLNKRKKNVEAKGSLSLKNKTSKQLCQLSRHKSGHVLPSSAGDDSANVVEVNLTGTSDMNVSAFKHKNISVLKSKSKGKKHLHRKPHRPFCRKSYSRMVTLHAMPHSPTSKLMPPVVTVENEGAKSNLELEKNGVSQGQRQLCARKPFRPYSVYTWIRDTSNDSKSKNTSNKITVDKPEGQFIHEDVLDKTGKNEGNYASEKTVKKVKESIMNETLLSKAKIHSKSLTPKCPNKELPIVTGKKISNSVVQKDINLSRSSTRGNKDSVHRKEVKTSKQSRCRNHSPINRSREFRNRHGVLERKKRNSQSPNKSQRSHFIASVKPSQQHFQSSQEAQMHHSRSSHKTQMHHSRSPLKRVRRDRSPKKESENYVRKLVPHVQTKISTISKKVEADKRQVHSSRHSRSISRHRSGIHSVHCKKSTIHSREHKRHSRSPVRRRSRSKSRLPRQRSRSNSRALRKLSRGRPKSSRRNSRSVSPPLRRRHESNSRLLRHQMRNSDTVKQRSRSPVRRRSRSPLIQHSKSLSHRRSHSGSRRTSRSLSSDGNIHVKRHSAKAYTHELMERGKLYLPYDVNSRDDRSAERFSVSQRKDLSFSSDDNSCPKGGFPPLFSASRSFQSPQQLQFVFPNTAIPPPYSGATGSMLHATPSMSASRGCGSVGNPQFSSANTPVQTFNTSMWVPNTYNEQNVNQTITKPQQFETADNMPLNVDPYDDVRKPSHLSPFENEKIFQDMRNAVNKLFGTSSSGEQLFPHTLSQTRQKVCGSSIQSSERYQVKNVTSAQVSIPGISDYNSSHGLSSQAPLNVDTEALLTRTLSHLKNSFDISFLNRDEMLRSAVLEMFPKEILKQVEHFSNVSLPEASQAHGIEGLSGHLSEPMNTHPPLPVDAKVQFKESSKISNPVNIFPIVKQNQNPSFELKHTSSNHSHGNDRSVFKSRSVVSAECDQKLSLAQRLASALVKLGMVDVPGSLLSEMLHTIGAFNPSAPLHDISESQIITILQKCGYLHSK